MNKRASEPDSRDLLTSIQPDTIMEQAYFATQVPLFTNLYVHACVCYVFMCVYVQVYA